MYSDNRSYLIALASCPSLEPHVLRRLIMGFGTAEAVWSATPEQWKSIVPIRNDTVTRLTSWCRNIIPGRLLEHFKRIGIIPVVYGDDDYPDLLTELSHPPLVLFIQGRWPLPEVLSLAIVGTRRASGYGLEATRWLAECVAGAGARIVSGLALGIDACAHSASLAVEGHTVAVLGCGVDVCYPVSNRKLYERIRVQGTLLSEYAPSTPALKHRFPERNRLIAGLSNATIVVQAGDKSGAIRTVDAALDLGREVYVVPGPITSIHFRGSHRILQQGARILIDPQDVLADFGLYRSATVIHVPERWKSLYDAIYEGASPEALVARLMQPLPHVYAGLLELELSGYIVKNIDGTYRRQR